MDRDTRILQGNAALNPRIVRTKPNPSEGKSGDIAIGDTSVGMKLFVKLGNIWHAFSPDKEDSTGQTTIEKYKISNLTLDRAYNANSTSTAELADIIGTLIRDLDKSGLLKYIKT